MQIIPFMSPESAPRYSLRPCLVNLKVKSSIRWSREANKFSSISTTFTSSINKFSSRLSLSPGLTLPFFYPFPSVSSWPVSETILMAWTLEIQYYLYSAEMSSAFLGIEFIRRALAELNSASCWTVSPPLIVVFHPHTCVQRCTLLCSSTRERESRARQIKLFPCIVNGKVINMNKYSSGLEVHFLFIVESPWSWCDHFIPSICDERNRLQSSSSGVAQWKGFYDFKDFLVSLSLTAPKIVFRTRLANSRARFLNFTDSLVTLFSPLVAPRSELI